MKKIISLSSVILCFAILIVSWGCNNPVGGQDPKEVTIHLQAFIKEDGKKHLKLSDSNGNCATDHLITSVAPGTTIYWKLKKFSKIDKIVRIYSPVDKKVIFIEDATDTGNNIFKLTVPLGLEHGTMEEYNIVFIYNDGSKIQIDPYIRID